MTARHNLGRVSRKERIARAVLGMPAGHPELVTCRPSRAEWKLFAVWYAGLWPNDEYMAIVAEQWRLDRPPGTQGWR